MRAPICLLLPSCRARILSDLLRNARQIRLTPACGLETLKRSRPRCRASCLPLLSSLCLRAAHAPTPSRVCLSALFPPPFRVDNIIAPSSSRPKLAYHPLSRPHSLRSPPRARPMPSGSTLVNGECALERRKDERKAHRAHQQHRNRLLYLGGGLSKSTGAAVIVSFLRPKDDLDDVCAKAIVLHTRCPARGVTSTVRQRPGCRSMLRLEADPTPRSQMHLYSVSSPDEGNEFRVDVLCRRSLAAVLWWRPGCHPLSSQNGTLIRGARARHGR